MQTDTAHQIRYDQQSSNLLYITWSKMDNCRMPKADAEQLLVDLDGKSVQLSFALTSQLEGLVAVWSTVKATTNLKLAKLAIQAKDKEIKKGYALFRESLATNVHNPRAIVEAVSLFSNFIRTANILQEAYVDFRGQGLLGGGITIEAKIDLSVAGLYRYSQFTHHLGKDFREIPYPCAGKSVTDKALANVFRSNVDYVQQIYKNALTMFRAELTRDIAVN